MSRLFVLLLIAAPVSAQTSHYGSIEATLPTSVKAGIESFVLSGEGARGEPGYVATAEVYGPNSNYLATCEVEWHRATKAATCIFEDGEIFRLRVNDESSSTFEDLRTGEGVTYRARFEGAEQTPVLAYEGAKTKAKMELDWGHELGVTTSIIAEAVILLFGDKGGAYDYPAEDYPTEGAITCPAGTEPACNSPNLTASAFHLIGMPNCCGIASDKLNRACRLRSGFNCCSQAACTGGCGFNDVIGCFCTRRGKFEVCLACGPGELN